MKKIAVHIPSIFVCLFSLLLISCSNNEQQNDFAERVQVAVRAVGNDVLLSQQDTTSLVMPVIATNTHTFELSFEKPLAFDPGSLNASVATNFAKAQLPPNYRVAVLPCENEEVAYSFEMQENMEHSLVPCGGRVLPIGCYTIQVKFTEAVHQTSQNTILFYVLVSLVLAFLVLVFYSKYHSFHSDKAQPQGTSLGSFVFYPDQNILVKEAEEIPLSRKECELLAIFIANPNQVVRREELTKKVWEDNGVVVGRSLDTYISKLRKKLQEDGAIKITNVHGVGYKLELA